MVIVGLCIILYGLTRTETNFDMLRYALTTNTKIDNKKGFVKSYKISSLIIGLLLLMLSFLSYAEVFSFNYTSLCFFSIILLKSIMRMFIQFKYTKKSTT
ncbi:hypothetical protein [Clostridium estertheticum]|uniref:hypothetical protein n=1 Tax=Clostridium estertheticum TaxID=238834 RepID=UPI001C7DE1B0|nr:hypothetical protein [Clostridium estertheticum]MBX4265113.1 hypothetical protein [Clostridium estertheticum]WLC81443.1 hypothetical protein KTC98_09610 [Clostridium estertheticum]WLC88576.1 hypothetical protein KTC95_21690 [Clostridium estertheticum]